VIGKTFLIAFLIALMISGLAFVYSAHFGSAQSGTNVTGIITSDMTWTQANSPYTLTGPVGVNTGVTLTIEPGVTVNMNTYYIQVNGTLTAIGSNANQIQINGPGSAQVFGGLIFTPTSTGWNETTGSGSIIEDSILNFQIPNWSSSLAITAQGAAPKINNNTINGNIAYPEGSPLISNNIINGGLGDNDAGGSPLISDNDINGSINIGGNGSPIIENNIIHYPVSHDPEGNLLFLGQGILVQNNYNALISNNQILGAFTNGIFMQQGNATIVGNLITTGLASGYGITINPQASALIQNNTIYGNKIEIDSTSAYPSTVVYNNIVKYSQNSIYLWSGASGNINATYDWWGTTDQQAINQTIYDSKDNFNLGIVNFVPFLTIPNPEAPTYTPTPTQSPSPFPTSTSTSTPTSTTSPSPSPSASQPRQPISSLTVELIIAVMAIVIVAVAIAAFVLGKKSGRKQPLREDFSI
jgi:parallel beta helix pectate lyase-like protein